METTPKTSIDTLSVLFTDLVSSTELRAQLGEEAADQLRRDHDRCLTDVVSDHDGTVVKGLGDGILATFPSAADAVAAAVAMQQAVELAGRADADRRVTVRVGVSVGDVSVEGGDVFGAPVVEASRLCSVANGGEILVADLVRALARGRGGFTFEPMGSLELKGVAEPVPACRVSWAPVPTPAADTDDTLPIPNLLISGESTGYIGRADLIERLQNEWQEVRVGRARTILLAGEPGIGKTRTAAEIARTAHSDGAVVLYGRCDEDLGVPYQPFVEALDWYTTHASNPALGRLPGEVARLLPEVRTRVRGVPDAVSSDPRSEEHRLFEAVALWLVEAARPTGLVLVLDDLHWAAKPTLMLLVHALRSAAAGQARLLVLATYRDTDIDRSHPLSGVLGELRRVPGVTRLPLSGLSQPEITAFLENAAGHELDADALALAEALHAETEGNPFFIGEVLRHLIESGQIRRDADRWVVRAPDQLSIPEGVRDVVGRRLSRLSDDANAVLSAAAVVGREVDLEVLVPIVEASEEAILDALDQAVRARLLEETGADRYRFGHALVRTTLYEELSATRRRRLHRRVADVLEKLRPDDVVALAHHAVQGGPVGGDVTRAVRYTIAAGENALARRAPSEAEHHFTQALELLDDVGDEDSAYAVTARCGFGEAQRDQADPAFRTTLLETARRARALGHHELLVRSVLADYRGMPSVIGGVDWDRVELTEAALHALGSEPSPERARVLAHLASERAFAGDEQRRIALADEATALARDLGDDQLIAWVVTRCGYAHFTPRRAASLLELFHDATQLADRVGDPSLRVQARLWWAAALLHAGDMRRNRAVVDDAATIAERDSVPLLTWLVTNMRTFQVGLSGDLDEAEALNLQALELGNRLQAPDCFNWWGAVNVLIQWARGRPGEQADAAGTYADEYPMTPEWRAAHALFLAEGGRLDEARQVMRDHAATLAPETLVDRPLPLHTLHELAQISFRLDDPDLAARTRLALEPFRGTWSHYFSGTIGPVVGAIGLCAAAEGEYDAAVRDLDDAIGESEEQGFAVTGATISTYLMEVLMRRRGQDDRDRVEAITDKVVAAAERFNTPLLAERARVLLRDSGTAWT